MKRAYYKNKIRKIGEWMMEEENGIKYIKKYAL